MRQQQYAAIVPVAVYRSAYFYYRPHHKGGIKVKSLSDLRGLRIGILTGTLLDRGYFENSGIRFEQSYNQQSLFRKLKLGRLDLVIEIDIVGKEAIGRLFPRQQGDFDYIPIPASTSPIAVMLAEEQPRAEAIADRLRQGLKQIIEDGSYLDIIKRHYHSVPLPEDWRDQLKRFDLLYSFGG